MSVKRIVDDESFQMVQELRLERCEVSGHHELRPSAAFAIGQEGVQKHLHVGTVEKLLSSGRVRKPRLSK